MALRPVPGVTLARDHWGLSVKMLCLLTFLAGPPALAFGPGGPPPTVTHSARELTPADARALAVGPLVRLHLTEAAALTPAVAGELSAFHGEVHLDDLQRVDASLLAALVTVADGKLSRMELHAPELREITGATPPAASMVELHAQRLTRVLGEVPVRLVVHGPTFLSNSGNAAFKLDVTLQDVPALTPAWRERLAGSAWQSVSLPDLTRLTAADAAVLGGADAELTELSLGGLDALDTEAALALGQLRLGVLSLRGLESLDAASIAALPEVGELQLRWPLQVDEAALAAVVSVRAKRLSVYPSGSEGLARLAAFKGDALEIHLGRNPSWEPIRGKSLPGIASFMGSELVLDLALDLETWRSLQSWQGDRLEVAGVEDTARGRVGGFIGPSQPPRPPPPRRWNPHPGLRELKLGQNATWAAPGPHRLPVKVLDLSDASDIDLDRMGLWKGTHLDLSGMSSLGLAQAVGLAAWRGERLDLSGLRKLRPLVGRVLQEARARELLLPPDLEFPEVDLPQPLTVAGEPQPTPEQQGLTVDSQGDSSPVSLRMRWQGDLLSVQVERRWGEDECLVLAGSGARHLDVVGPMSRDCVSALARFPGESLTLQRVVDSSILQPLAAYRGARLEVKFEWTAKVRDFELAYLVATTRPTLAVVGGCGPEDIAGGIAMFRGERLEVDVGGCGAADLQALAAFGGRELVLRNARYLGHGQLQALAGFEGDVIELVDPGPGIAAQVEEVTQARVVVTPRQAAAAPAPR